MNNRARGTEKENQASQYLKEQGMEILQCNYRCRQGEIDVIGFHNGYLVFLEVKYRKSLRAGSPEEAVSIRKQLKICQVSDYYRYIHGYNQETAVRYDVVALNDSELKWYQNAFDYIGRK